AQRKHARFRMTVDDVAKHIRFVIGRIADSIIVTVGTSIVAPVIATSFFGKGIWPLAALLCFEWRLPNLVRVTNKCISDEDVLFRNVAQIKANVVCRDDVAFKSILIGLLHKKSPVLSSDHVIRNSRGIKLLEDESVTPICRDVVPFNY